MPEHDLFDLDDAFSSLERDIATISSPRGASQAVGTARRRRRTTYGSIAAVAVLAVGGVALGHGLGGSGGAVGPSDQPLPPPTPLSAAAFSTATAGWVGDWSSPSSSQAKTLDSITCLDSGGDTQALDKASRTGGVIYGAGTSEVAYVLGLDFPVGKIDAATAEIAASVANCHPSSTTTTTYADGSTVTFYVLPGSGGAGDIELWTGQLKDTLGLAVVGGTPDAPSPEVAGRVGDLLLGALQVDSTFTRTPGGAISSSSASASSVGFGSVSESDFAQALGSWPNGWEQRGTKYTDNPLPCAGDWTVGSSSGSGSSLGTNGDQEAYSFDSAENAHSSVQALTGDLHACAASPATITTVAGTGTIPVTVAVGSGSGASVTWIVERGSSVAYITIPGSSTPPDSVSQAVGDLLSKALVADNGGPPPVESSTPVQQQGSSTSSSSSSAAAPTS
ncbi:hypothetical protein [Nocardioides cynanchi]|uniref:hypothetical protein n=1 Tax=Nocardioides cynanchi TaxID=2558918 RepID=UPI0012482941|nr:hypothetical protein [Nocardioides cynanchi]